MTRIQVDVTLTFLDGKWIARVRRDNYAWQQPRPHGTYGEASAWALRTVEEALRDNEGEAA